MNGLVKLQWTIKVSFFLMVCSRTQGMTATLEDRGVCVCLKEEEKKITETQCVTVTALHSTGHSVEEHPDGHRPKWREYWSTPLETGRAGGTISFLLNLGFVRWKGQHRDTCMNFASWMIHFLRDRHALWLFSTEFTWVMLIVETLASCGIALHLF